jgi:hypothetical protein
MKTPAATRIPQFTMSSAPNGVTLEAACAEGGEARVQVVFDHGNYAQVESLTLVQAAALSAALREFVKR